MAEATMTPVTKTNGAVESWDPFGLFGTLEQQFEKLWHRPFFTGGMPWPVAYPAMTTGMFAYMPRTDVYEKDGTLVFKAELPGMAKEDIHVEILEGDLVIKGDKQAEREVKDTAYYRMEQTYGSFYRRLPLPFEVEPAKITATLTDGVLEIVIPKPATAKPEATKIPVA